MAIILDCLHILGIMFPVKHTLSIVCNHLLAFWFICHKLASEITSLTSPMPYITNITDSIFIPEISHVEVRNVVNTLRNSSHGWDEISAGIYKSYQHFL